MSTLLLIVAIWFGLNAALVYLFWNRDRRKHMAACVQMERLERVRQEMREDAIARQLAEIRHLPTYHGSAR